MTTPNPPTNDRATAVAWWRRPVVLIGISLAVVAALVTAIAVASSGGSETSQAPITTTSTVIGSFPSSTMTSSTTGTPTTIAPDATTTTNATASTGASTTAAPPGGHTTTTTPEALWPAYSEAWKSACREVWSHSPNAKMYDPDDTATAHPYSDCLADLDPLFLDDAIKTEAQARRSGRDDALQFASLMSVSGLLCWLRPASENFAGCVDPSKPAVVVPPPAAE